MIKVKYATCDPATRSRQFAYRRHLANTTTFRIEQFWELACQSGFVPRCIHLFPKAPHVHDERYAYFFLDRPASSFSSSLDALGSAFSIRRHTSAARICAEACNDKSHANANPAKPALYFSAWIFFGPPADQFMIGISMKRNDR